MAIEHVGATVEFATVQLGQVIGFTLPDDEAKEIEITNLNDTREQFILSAMSVGQEFTIDVRLDPEAPQLAKGSFGAFKVTLTKQTAGSTNAKTYDFDGFVRMASGPAFDFSASDGVTQSFTIRLTTEVTEANEA